MSFLLQRAPVARASVDLRVAPHRRHDYAWHVICGGDVIRLANSLVVISSRDAPTRLVRDGIGASKIIGKRRLREMQNVMIDTAAIRLTETILGDEAPDLEETLKAIAANIGVLHIAYAPLSVQKGNDVNLLSAICTYPMAWQSRYFLKQYARIDPVLARGNEAVLPFDWDELPRDDPAIEAFFDDAAEHQLGRNGLGIPVRDRKGMRSLVSFTSDHSKNGWAEYKRRSMVKLQAIAVLIDCAAGVNSKVRPDSVELSKREEECLIWAARGKTYHEVAGILDLSYASVKTYLDTARHKLSCINLTHAVAVAIATGVIPAKVLRKKAA
jgi:DNA-binding CsgD family transcriptional regulator